MDVKVNISKSTLNRIDRLSDEMELKRDELILRALKKYLFIAEMQRIRKRIKPKMKKLGYKREEDIFSAIS